MKDLQSIYQVEKGKLSSDKVNIEEIPLAEIKKKNAATGHGFCEIKWDGSTWSCTISIDISLTTQEKLAVMFHEYGHWKFMEGKTYDEVMQKREYNLFKYDIDNEYCAFINELSETRRLYDMGTQSLLPLVLQNLQKRLTGNQDDHYYVATYFVTKSRLWSECKNLIVDGNA